jgi:hypothetical protein
VLARGSNDDVRLMMAVGRLVVVGVTPEVKSGVRPGAGKQGQRASGASPHALPGLAGPGVTKAGTLTALHRALLPGPSCRLAIASSRFAPQVDSSAGFATAISGSAPASTKTIPIAQ